MRTYVRTVKEQNVENVQHTHGLLSVSVSPLLSSLFSDIIFTPFISSSVCVKCRVILFFLFLFYCVLYDPHGLL